MEKIQTYITELTNKIQIKQKEIILEKEHGKKNNLKKELIVLELKKEIAVRSKKIKQIEL